MTCVKYYPDIWWCKWDLENKKENNKFSAGFSIRNYFERYYFSFCCKILMDSGCKFLETYTSEINVEGKIILLFCEAPNYEGVWGSEVMFHHR
jgi:hypothetical protein